MSDAGGSTHTFDQRSEEVVSRFLQSAVVLDDLARMGTEPTTGNYVDAESLRKPNLDDDATRSDPERARVSRGATDGLQQEPGVPLDAKPLIDGFANFGVVCAVLRPDPDEIESGQWANSGLVAAAKRADVVVLDWRLGKSYGTDTLAIMRNIIEDDSRYGRLRLFAIYTGEPDLVQIATEVKETVAQFYGESVDMREGEFWVSKGPVRAAVIPKADNRSPAQQGVSESLLPELIIREFADMTKGILRNLALVGLAAVRDNAHRILAKFDASLDAAYLGHRMLLPNPSDAEEQMVSVLGAELLSVLEDSPAKIESSLHVAQLWMNAKSPDDTVLQTPVESLPNADPIGGRLQLLTDGIDHVQLSRRVKGRLSNRPAGSFIEDADEALKADHEFAMLLSLKTRYPDICPKLTLGTVVRQHVDNDGYRFYLCLQPKCDAVRLKSPTGFPLLPLAVRTEDDRFSLVLRDEQRTWIHLYVDPRPSRLTIRSFNPSGASEEEIVARHRLGVFMFEDTGGVEYQWLAELKTEHAMRIAGDVSASLARAGPDYSEWLRRADNRQR